MNCFVLDILFIFQILTPSFVSPLKIHLFHPLSPCSTTYPLLLPCSGIPLHLGIESSQGQGPLLPLMSNKSILCYICSWSHGLLHVYSLLGGLVHGSFGQIYNFVKCFCIFHLTIVSSSVHVFLVLVVYNCSKCI